MEQLQQLCWLLSPRKVVLSEIPCRYKYLKVVAVHATKSRFFKYQFQIAMCHLFFNVTGILIFYPIPFMRLPIRMAKFLGNIVAQYRWFAIFYMILLFGVLPGVVLGLSFAGNVFVIVFSSIVVAIIIFIIAVNIIREKKPNLLPRVLRTWTWLPVPFRSLEPYDKIFKRLAFCRRLAQKAQDNPNDSKSQVTEYTLNNKTDENITEEILHSKNLTELPRELL